MEARGGLALYRQVDRVCTDLRHHSRTIKGDKGGLDPDFTIGDAQSNHGPEPEPSLLEMVLSDGPITELGGDRAHQ